MRHLPALYLTIVVLPMLAGCTTPPSKFYILSSVATDTTAQPALLATAIGVGPVVLPKYLDRPQIALRSGANELFYNETHRWAETLTDNITSVLAQNLALLVPTDKVSVFPWGRSTAIDYQVIADISRFDADASGIVVLSAYWKLYREESRQVIAQKKTVITEPAGDASYANIVAAQSRALAALSREITVAIRAASGR